MVFKVSFQVHWTYCHKKDRINNAKVQSYVVMHPVRHHQPRPEGVNIKKWEWQLINEKIEDFNRHRLERLSPLEILYMY